VGISVNSCMHSRIASITLSLGLVGCGEDIIRHERRLSASDYPTAPPAPVCASMALSAGSQSAPAGAIIVPSGNNSGADFGQVGAVYWFEPGVHTLGSSSTAQISPGNSASFVGAPSSVLDGQSINEFAFTQHASGVSIRYLEIRNFVSPDDQAVVNHDGGAGWLVEHVYLHHNTGAAIFVSSENRLRFSCITDNGQYGLQGIGPGGGGSAYNLVVENNEIARNTSGGKLWDVENGQVANNWIHDNGVGIWVDGNSRDVTIERNVFERNDSEAIIVSSSYNTQVRHNAFSNNALGKGQEFADQSNDFPVSAVYVTNSGGDTRLAGTALIEIESNHFENNWSGVSLWDDANRFCGSPASGDNARCTLVSAAATTATCVQPRIATPPLYDDCRWKTANVAVHDNDFWLTPETTALVPVPSARQALISNLGTAPDWSPYLGTAIEDAVTYKQNNRFWSNHYRGTWYFVAHDTTNVLSIDAWRAAPYLQDSGSVLE
jgi:parallel beta-helix repeat protein